MPTEPCIPASSFRQALGGVPPGAARGAAVLLGSAKPARAFPTSPPPCLANVPCQALDRVWLAEGPFVAGCPQPTIADLQLACELEQLRLLDGALQVGLGWLLGWGCCEPWGCCGAG